MDHYKNLAGALFARKADSDPNPTYDATIKLVDKDGAKLTTDYTVSLMKGSTTVDAESSSNGEVTLTAEDGVYDIELTGEPTATKVEPAHILIDGASKTKTITVYTD